MRPLEAFVCSDSEYYNYSPGTLARTYLLYPICVGEFTYAPGYDLRRTTFDSFLLEVILEGQVEIETEGQCFRAGAGSVVLIDCHKPHRYASATGWHALWVHFDGVPARGYFELITRTNGFAFLTHGQNEVLQALRALMAGFRQHAALSEPQMAKLLTDALTVLTQPCESRGASANAPVMERAVASISHALGNEPDVAELAREAGMSEYYFIRVFKAFVGMTPRQYIISARMAHARYLLKTTALPVAEIAGLVGYRSESMFSATFRRFHGLTPRAYRQDAPLGRTTDSESTHLQHKGEER